MVDTASLSSLLDELKDDLAEDDVTYVEDQVKANTDLVNGMDVITASALTEVPSSVVLEATLKNPDVESAQSDDSVGKKIDFSTVLEELDMAPVTEEAQSGDSPQSEEAQSGDTLDLFVKPVFDPSVKYSKESIEHVSELQNSIQKAENEVLETASTIVIVEYDKVYKDAVASWEKASQTLEDKLSAANKLMESSYGDVADNGTRDKLQAAIDSSKKAVKKDTPDSDLISAFSTTELTKATKALDEPMNGVNASIEAKAKADAEAAAQAAAEAAAAANSYSDYSSNSYSGGGSSSGSSGGSNSSSSSGSSECVPAYVGDHLVGCMVPGKDGMCVAWDAGEDPRPEDWYLC